MDRKHLGQYSSFGSGYDANLHARAGDFFVGKDSATGEYIKVAVYDGINGQTYTSASKAELDSMTRFAEELRKNKA